MKMWNASILYKDNDSEGKIKTKKTKNLSFNLILILGIVMDL